MTVGSVNFAADNQNKRPQINVVVNADTTQLDESIAKTKELIRLTKELDSLLKSTGISIDCNIRSKE